MNKFSAQESYRRMAEFVIDSEVSNERSITRAISDATGASFEAVSKWKDGRTDSIKTRYIHQFCEKYKASPDYITAGALPKKRKGAYSPEFEEASELFPHASKEVQRIVVDLLRASSKKET